MKTRRENLAVVVLLTALAALGALGALGASSAAHAADVPMVIPYSGYVEIDGVAYTGDLEMRFSLYDAEETLEWSETYTDGDYVSVVDGRFSVYLGAIDSSIPSDLLSAESLVLRIYVQMPGGSGYTRLYPDQSIVPVPYALWSTESGPLEVHGNLTLGTRATIDGAIGVVGNLDINSNGFIDVGGMVSGASLAAGTIADPGAFAAAVRVLGGISSEGPVSIEDGGALILRSGGQANAVLTQQDDGDALGIAVGTGQTVTIVGRPQFEDTVYTTGAITVSTGDVIADEWTLQDDEPVIYFDYLELQGSLLGGDQYVFQPESWDGDLGSGAVSCSNYTCFIVGVKFWNDGWCTGSTSSCSNNEILEAHMSCGLSGWLINVTANAGNPTDYDRQIGIACIPNDYF